MLSHLLYLVHPNLERQMFIDLNANKQFGFGVMIYHLKENLAKGKYLTRKVVERIRFLSQLFHLTETCYWPTELELANIVWILQKICCIIESSKHLTLIFINYSMALGIAE